MFLLLTYSFHSQALSTNTINTIQGSQPYLTFDGGTTKVTTVDGLLGITLSNGTSITPATNTSTASNPIILPTAGQSFANIDMFVPTTTDSIALNTLIGAPNNYWGDDDGDGQGVNGITVTGSLSLKITDKENQAVSRNTVLNMCKAPYKVVLSSTNGVLSTQYGDPNNSTFSTSSATYYISPNSPPVICYVRPNLQYGTNGGEISSWNFSGPTNMWNSKKGFIPQSTNAISYDRNFPTTGSNKLYFDLLISGNSPLTWPSVTKAGITATMTLNPPIDSYVNPDGASSVRVTLTGPTATGAQQISDSPGLINKPSLPQNFELVGYDSSNNAVVKYGFVLKQWFVHRGTKKGNVTNHSSWCSRLGYRMSLVKDLTNAVCLGINANSEHPCTGAKGAMPSSTMNNYMRHIGAGFMTEWGYLYRYTDSGFNDSSYWTSAPNGSDPFPVYSDTGHIHNSIDSSVSIYGICTYP